MSALPDDDWAVDPVALDPFTAADRLAASVKPRPPAPPAAGDPPPRLFYPSVDRFVAEQLSPLYRRPLGAGRTWCPEWWRHAEGITRLAALWRSWEHLRLEPALGMSVWLRDHADPHMGVLLDADGPFHGCSVERGHNAARLDPLKVTPPPEGMFAADPNGDNGDNVPNAPTGG